MLCSTSRIVDPELVTQPADEAHQIDASCGFIPAAGSSSRSSFGSVASARAISSRRWLPYGRLVAASSARRSRPKIFSSSSRALARLALLDVVAAGAEDRVGEHLMAAQVVRRHDVLEHRHVGEQADVLECAPRRRAS